MSNSSNPTPASSRTNTRRGEGSGWRSEVRRRLEEAIADSREQSETPLAVFDFDNTCIAGDIGELFSHFLIDEMAYRYDLDEFWELIDPRDGREQIRELTMEALELDRQQREHSDVYREYLAEMGAVYGRKYAREGRASCYRWAVRLHVGMTPKQIRQLTHEAIDREMASAMATEQRETGRGETVRIRRGIRRLAEIHRLMGRLSHAGFDVWIVSATNRWSVEAFAERGFGVPPERVLGNRVTVDEKGRLTDATQHPVLFGEGKVDIIDQEIGRRPAIVLGDSITDLEMMEHATHMPLLIDHGNEPARQRARERGWAVQPQGELTHERELE